MLVAGKPAIQWSVGSVKGSLSSDGPATAHAHRYGERSTRDAASSRYKRVVVCGGCQAGVCAAANGRWEAPCECVVAAMQREPV